MPRLEHLPVAVDLPGVLGEEVAAYVEAEGGWQVVAAEGPLPPALRIVPAPVAGTSCVVVTTGPLPAEAVHAGLRAGAVDVVAWPEQRARLLEAPLRLGTAGAADDGGPALVRVGGAAGGVGTSTVALGVAGLVAWAGAGVVVVGGPDLLRLAGIPAWSGPGAAELAALAAADAAEELSALARPVPGVDRLRVLGHGTGRQDGGSGEASYRGWDGRLPAAGDGRPSGLGWDGRAPVRGDVRGWPCDVVVVDAGTAAADCDLVIARPDAGLRGAPADAPVLLIGDGPLDRRGVRRTLGTDPVGCLPTSARVARAGLAGRVPSGLPGSWLRALREALHRLQDA